MAAAALQGCSSHEPFKDPLPGHTLPRTFLTANPPWYGNLRQLSPTLEMPAKGSGLCAGCPEEPSVQSRNSQGVRNRHPTGDWEGLRHRAYPRWEGWRCWCSGEWSVSWPRDHWAWEASGELLGWGPQARRHPVLCLGCSSQTSMWLSLCCHSGLNSAVTPRMRPSLSPRSKVDFLLFKSSHLIFFVALSNSLLLSLALLQLQ